MIIDRTLPVLVCSQQMNLSVFKLGLIGLSFVVVISGIYLAVGGVNIDWAVMAGFFKNLWHKIVGGGGKAKEGVFPDTLEGFGYHFNKEGQLLDKNGGSFQYVVRKDDMDYNQQRYEALGDVVTEHLYHIMEKDLKLERVHVPLDAKKGEARSFIFRSKDAPKNKNLMVLIHGSGAVRAGQWSRKLIINENINTGSQLPYIRKAVNDGYGVIVMNPNLNEARVKGNFMKIRGSESPEQHGVYVWHHFVHPAKALNIAVVAHSYGGVVACAIALEFLKEWRKRVFSVVFTDSVHMEGRQAVLWDKPVKEFMKQRAVNFVSSDEPLNTQLKPYHKETCLEVSAGTPEHERTSHSCFDSAFEFIRNNFAQWTKNGTIAPRDFLGRPLKFKSEL